MTETAIYPINLHTENSKAIGAAWRLAVIRWKATKNADGTTKVASPSRCVSVPQLTLTAQPAVLGKLLQASFEEQQDQVIREEIEQLISEGVAISDQAIAASKLTEEAIAAYYSETSSTGGRLSNKSIEAWFDASLKDQLLVKLAAVMDIGEQATKEQEQKLAKALEQYKNLLKNLSSPRAAMPIKMANDLQKAVELDTDSKSATQQKLLEKLIAFQKPAKATELEISL